MEQILIFAGIGGQGLQLAGKLLVKAALQEGKEVSFFPIYGGQKRGGISSCYVVISDQPIGAPVRAQVDLALLMDPLGFDNYHQQIKPGGWMVVNTSSVAAQPEPGDYQLRQLPFQDIAQQEVGSGKTIGILALGYVIGLSGIVSPQAVLDVLSNEFARDDLRAINIAAFNNGLAKAQG